MTAFFASNLTQLEFDFEFEKFFPKDHPDSRLYAKHVAQFGYDNDFLHIILSNPTSVFDESFLSRASQFEKELIKIEDIIQVFSPLSLQHVVKTPTGLIIFPLMHVDNPEKFQEDSLRIFGNQFYKSAFSDDGTSLSIYVRHAHFDDPARSDKILSSIYEKARLFGFNKIRLVGKLNASQSFIQYIKEDFGKYLIGSLIISFALLLLIFRSIKSAVMPFIVSLLTMIWLFGLMVFLGFKINLLSSLIPPILFFVSMSDAVHLMNALRKSTLTTTSLNLKEAIHVVCGPTLLTSITTAIGFLSLIWINTEPVQLLGIFTALGVLIAFILTFTVGLIIAPKPSLKQGQHIVSIPNTWATALQNKRSLIIGIFIFLLCTLVPGTFFLKINSYLLEDLPKDSIVRADFGYADEHFGGSKPFEVRVEVIDTSNAIWDKKILDEVVKIEDYLINEYPIVKVQSPATIIKYLTMVNNGGLNQFYLYPNELDEYQETIKLKNRIDPKRMDKLVTEDGKVARLIGFFPELGSLETGIRNNKLLQYLEEDIDSSLIRYHITGTTYLIDKSHELLSMNLIKGLLTAVILIALILGFYFRSWKLLIISFIPNIIPLLMIAGIIGWLGISLKMTTSIIFTVAFGIAVDDTIHMMSYFLKNKSKDPLDRITQTFKHAGSAMLITTIIMTAGFSLFLFSSFGATYYMGLFISLSLTIALLVDLTILPLLLMRYKRDA